MRRRGLRKSTQDDAMRLALLVATLVAVAIAGAWFLQSTIPRHIVLASGTKDGMYHQFAQRYKPAMA